MNEPSNGKASKRKIKAEDVIYTYDDVGKPTGPLLEYLNFEFEYLEELITLNSERIKKLERNIPTMDLRDDFECSNCGSKELVAINILCTKCKTPSWWGWHPKS